MADLKEYVKMVQFGLKNQDEDFIPMIEIAITSAWAIMSKYRRWYFMRAFTPLKISLTAGTKVYKTNKDVGLLYYISDVNGKPLIKYKSNDDFKTRYERLGESDADTPTIFTDAGFKSDVQYIQLLESPSTSRDVYLQYFESGSSSNVNKCPLTSIMCLLNGAYSMVSPPQEIRQGKERYWEDVKLNYNKLFWALLDKMLEIEKVVDVIENDFQTEDLVYDRIQEANNILD